MPAGISSRHLCLTLCRSVFYLLIFFAPRPWFLDDIGSRKGKVVNDKGNLRWRFPVNSVSGKDRQKTRVWVLYC